MPAYEEAGLPGRKRTLMIVEDNQLSRDLLSALLEENYTVLAAANGQEGIDLLKANYDDLSLILLDLYMPVADGFEFLRFRKTSDKYFNIPVIVSTASDAVQDEIEALKLGANDFVIKPYNGEVILHRVSNTIRMRESASLVNQLRWDDGTGLYSREFFCRRVDNLLAAFEDDPFDMVCCDIRNFKVLNDRYGRERCDALLRSLAHKLEEAIPDVQTSGRVDGDSFGFLIKHREDDWTNVLSSVVDSLEYGRLYVRFGIIQNVDHALSAVQLCDRAQIALVRLHDSVGVGVAWYDDELRQQQSFEQELIEDMPAGVRNGEFMVYYQPKHDMKTGKIAGAEALIRWEHPTYGFLNPGLFIPVMERSGCITDLDVYVCAQASKEIARMESLGLQLVPISINFSPLDFDDHDMPAYVAEMTARYGIDPTLLHIELTETAFAENPDIVADALGKLRSMGCRVELDDFGTGYSSLAMLNMLPLDIIKIDGGMMRKAAQSKDYRIVRSAIQIAQVLGLQTVVEGVETKEEMNVLGEFGCDIIQGFYFSRPLCQKDFEQYLQTH